MMEILWVIIGILFALLLWRYYFLISGIKQIRQQLTEILKAEETNQLITNPHNFSELLKLVQEINVILVSDKKHFAHFKDIEQELKEQITNISHDLRTPLASILGYFELINDDETTESEKEQYLTVIEKRAGLLGNLLDHYFDLVQIESEDQELQMSYIDVGQLLTDVLATFYYDFSDRNIIVEISAQLETIKVLADEKLLQRAFINLVQNILKHGKEQCIITSEKRGNQRLTIIKNKVENPTQIEIDKVFNRLYSADKTRSTGNTGIGLTITRLLIEKMGHQIQAELTDDGWFLIKITWHV